MRMLILNNQRNNYNKTKPLPTCLESLGRNWNSKKKGQLTELLCERRRFADGGEGFLRDGSSLDSSVAFFCSVFISSAAFVLLAPHLSFSSVFFSLFVFLHPLSFLFQKYPPWLLRCLPLYVDFPSIFRRCSKAAAEDCCCCNFTLDLLKWKRKGAK